MASIAGREDNSPNPISMGYHNEKDLGHDGLSVALSAPHQQRRLASRGRAAGGSEQPTWRTSQ